MIKKLILKIENKKIPILFGENFLKKYFFNNTSSYCIIIDEKIAALYPHLLNIFPPSLIISLQASEKNKSRKTKAFIEDRMFKKNFPKDGTIIAIGGGMILDIASFTASTYKRGIPLILIPTTLLAMVDASLGGKTGINTIFGKNLLGTFYQPKNIFIDFSFLSTLPKREFLSGFAEILKYGLILDKKILKCSQKIQKNNLIYHCCKLKKKIIEIDTKDQNKRNILNFGHTIGHSIEKLDDLSHGEAISLGMIASCYISYNKGFLKKEEFLKIWEIFKKNEFSLIFSKNISYEDLLKKILQDKKNKNNAIHFILLKKIGKVQKYKKKYSIPISEKLLKKTFYWMKKNF